MTTSNSDDDTHSHTPKFVRIAVASGGIITILLIVVASIVGNNSLLLSNFNAFIVGGGSGPQNSAMAQSDNNNNNNNGDVDNDDSSEAIARTTTTPAKSVTYLSTQTVLVPAKGDADAEALCRDRDVVLSGGYAMGVYNSTNLQSITAHTAMLYSNTAIRVINGTTIHEGWTAGLINSGTIDLTITANALCLDIN